MEQALRESERRYHDLADIAPIGIFSSSRKALVYLNQRAFDICGLTIKEAFSGEWLNVVHPEDREPTLATRQIAIKTGTPWRCEPRFVHKDGSVHRIHCDATPQHDSNGEFQGFVGTLMDITARREMEQKLRESDARYQSLVEASPVGIFRTDPAGSCSYVNPRACDITGLGLEESLGNGWITAIHPDDRAEIIETGRRARAGRDPARMEVRVCRADGTMRWVIAHMASARDPAGALVGVVGTLTDVTASKQAEEELARHHERLEELVEERTAELERSQRELMQRERLASLGTFAAGIAHQINNPAGMILLAAQHALDNVDDSGVVASALHDIVDDAKRCGGITRSVLEFARGSGRGGVSTDLNALAEGAADLLRREAAERNAILEVELDSTLPRIVLHRAAIEQVLINVIDNALHAGAKRVVLRTERISDDIHLTIEDDGSGISEADLPFVVDPFYSTRRDTGGTGLGLALAHGIVTSQGGSFAVESELGHGTIVRIRLPAAPDGAPG
jgi:PAS domain S-box-containing protein